ncbi:hypothetical protein PHLCEN_2v8041 [Hermanssonia centrifuga]|uniref:YDG domain-containing protein n=1 Tax=Hermanssonia centrifuga TaxID=98765 RepID=A0A2R6NUS8_9APHY|nr:hypothetical protein PHLCEN_2v8041 [Hermanssonia centrifuga]
MSTYRRSCSADHVHPPLQAGIYGRKADGARSVVLGGGFDEDEDHGDTFTYIGSGGRESDVRWGPQTRDQSFENTLNQSLRMSALLQKPVRVIRGSELKSVYAPYAGFRYDGLYTVHNPREEMGGAGLVVCKFDFRRCPDQPPLPRSEIPLSERDDITMRRVKFKKTRKQEQGNAVASSSRTGLSKSRGESVSSRASADVIEISDDEDEYEDEDEEDQEDLFAAIDKVEREFQIVQQELQRLNQPSDDLRDKRGRRELLIAIGHHVDKVLKRKKVRSADVAWWRHELWAYVSTFLPTAKTMDPSHLEELYHKYEKREKEKQRRR